MKIRVYSLLIIFLFLLSCGDSDKGSAESLTGGYAFTNAEVIEFLKKKGINTSDPSTLTFAYFEDTDDNELKYLQSLTSLINLEIKNSPRMTNQGLQYISNLTKLTMIVIGNSNLSDEGLSHLANLSELTDIYIPQTNVAGDGLKYLKNLQKLKYINIDNTSIGNDGLEQLKDLPAMKDIKAKNTQVTAGYETQLNTYRTGKGLSIVDIQR